MIFILVTCAHDAEAAQMAETLVEARLAACVQVMAGHQSVYRWQGAVARAGETNILVKTTADRFDDVCAAVRARHSYDTPCIASWAADRVDADFERWLRAQVD